METLNDSRLLFVAAILALGICFGILYYIGHKRKWSIFYDHDKEEWVFARKNSIIYQILGDPEKWIYPTILTGITFFLIILIIHIIRAIF